MRPNAVSLDQAPVEENVADLLRLAGQSDFPIGPNGLIAESLPETQGWREGGGTGAQAGGRRPLWFRRGGRGAQQQVRFAPAPVSPARPAGQRGHRTLALHVVRHRDWLGPLAAAVGRADAAVDIAIRVAVDGRHA